MELIKKELTFKLKERYCFEKIQDIVHVENGKGFIVVDNYTVSKEGSTNYLHKLIFIKNIDHAL